MFTFISGMKYQSNLNEIDKSEQKSQADTSSKVFEWPPKDDAQTDSKFQLLALFLFLLKLVKKIKKTIFFKWRAPIFSEPFWMNIPIHITELQCRNRFNWIATNWFFIQLLNEIKLIL